MQVTFLHFRFSAVKWKSAKLKKNLRRSWLGIFREIKKHLNTSEAGNQPGRQLDISRRKRLGKHPHLNQSFSEKVPEDLRQIEMMRKEVLLKDKLKDNKPLGRHDTDPKI